jgi:hypothetical protein
MPEAAGRRALGAGRIRTELLDAVVAERLDGGPLPGLELDRATLGARVVAHGLRDAEGDELAWILNESPALRELPADLPEPARAALLRLGPPARVLPALWAACREKVRAEPAPAVALPLRPRDRLVALALACLGSPLGVVQATARFGGSVRVRLDSQLDAWVDAPGISPASSMGSSQVFGAVAGSKT